MSGFESFSSCKMWPLIGLRGIMIAYITHSGVGTACSHDSVTHFPSSIDKWSFSSNLIFRSCLSVARNKSIKEADGFIRQKPAKLRGFLLFKHTHLEHGLARWRLPLFTVNVVAFSRTLLQIKEFHYFHLVKKKSLLTDFMDRSLCVKISWCMMFFPVCQVFGVNWPQTFLFKNVCVRREALHTGWMRTTRSDIGMFSFKKKWKPSKLWDTGLRNLSFKVFLKNIYPIVLHSDY